jgi:heme A synthase
MPFIIPEPPEIYAGDEKALSARRFANFAWFVVGYNVAVVLEGGLVRATGSGAGCGNHWPLCNGQVVFGTPAMATVIEFAHRSMTGIDLVLILGLLVWAVRAFPKHHAVRLGAALSTVFLFTEALIGAALVKFGLVVHDASPARAAVLSLHLTNTLSLLACLTLTAWWVGHPRISLEERGVLRRKRMAWFSLAAVAFLGITGALAALADTLYPVRSLAAGFAQDLSPDANFIVRLRALHPFVAAAVGLWVMYYASLRTADARGTARAVIALVLAQFLAGLLNMLLLAPVGMQIMHLLLADLLWIALVALCSDGLSVQRQ